MKLHKLIIDKSILELFLFPVFKLQWMKNFAGAIRQPYHYEHTYTLPVIALLFSKIPFGIYGYFIASFIHVIVKEVILDWSKNKLNWNQLKVDLTTRVFGFLIGLLSFI